MFGDSLLCTLHLYQSIVQNKLWIVPTKLALLSVLWVILQIYEPRGWVSGRECFKATFSNIPQKHPHPHLLLKILEIVLFESFF